MANPSLKDVLTQLAEQHKVLLSALDTTSKALLCLATMVGGEAAGAPVTAPAAAEPEKEKRTRRTKEQIAADAAASAPPAVAKQDGPDFGTVRSAFKDLLNHGGPGAQREKVIAIFTKHGLAKVDDAKPEIYPALLSDAKSALDALKGDGLAGLGL